jgi:beta-lactamase regulating signal transducer with metallopeptidase domain
MTVAWTLYVLLVGTLLACGALAVDGILRRTTLPTRWVWVSALAGIVCMAVVAPRRDATPAAFKIPVTQNRVASVVEPALPTRGFAAVLERGREAVRSSVTALIAAANRRLPASAVFALSIAWGVMSAVMLVVLVVVNRRVDRDRRAWPLAEVFGTPVRITPTVGPAVMGLSAPEIVVPRWLLERSPDEQRLVIVHEREHLAARDQLLPVGGLIVAAILPWHPAVWWALSRLRLAIELDCDARVLNRGVQPRPYGALLIDIAGRCAGHRVGVLALADRTSHLERRLLAMKNTQRRFTLVRTGALGAIAMLSIVMACEARLPTSAEVDKMDVASAEKAAVQAKLLDEKAAQQVVYKVDGVVVTAAEAHAVSSNRIASVSVTKSGAASVKGDGTAFTVVDVSTADSSKKGVPMKIMFKKGAQEGTIETEHGTLTSSKGFTGLLFVDGVLAPAGSLATLSPNEIASIEILKGEAATKVSTDPAAANGVIRVTTKHAQQNE